MDGEKAGTGKVQGKGVGHRQGEGEGWVWKHLVKLNVLFIAMKKTWVTTFIGGY